MNKLAALVLALTLPFTATAADPTTLGSWTLNVVDNPMNDVVNASALAFSADKKWVLAIGCVTGRGLVSFVSAPRVLDYDASRKVYIRYRSGPGAEVVGLHLEVKKDPTIAGGEDLVMWLDRGTGPESVIEAPLYAKGRIVTAIPTDGYEQAKAAILAACAPPKEEENAEAPD